MEKFSYRFSVYRHFCSKLASLKDIDYENFVLTDDEKKMLDDTLDLAPPEVNFLCDSCMPCESNYSMNVTNDIEEAIEVENDTEEAIEVESDIEEAIEVENDTEEAIEVENDTEEAIEVENDTEEAIEVENDTEEQLGVENEN
ncbi:hypothetical protein HNY73_008756 [Argiope bruennichi]|uniref:Uncharacterized protein n=1 Tax=Argiope bruennichi TaxID=94029 RepID=A0A8T0FA25_ARGBR|nr:hypothetical protein HNY73_008756 [Argiope bruennichi]